MIPIIKRNKNAIYPNSNMIDIMRELIQNPEEARPIHSGNIDSTGEQENFDVNIPKEPTTRRTSSLLEVHLNQVMV